MNGRICVAICTRNRMRYLKNCIRSILSQSIKPDEMIVVDDASQDGTEEMLNEMLEEIDELQVVRFRKQQSTARARNIAISLANSEIIAFLDDDSVAEKRWLENILNNYHNEKIIGVGGPIIEIGRKRKTKDDYPALDKDGNIIGASFRNRLKTKGLRKKAVSHLQGGNMSFRRSVLLKTMGVHKLFSGTAYREETDLSMSAAKSGILLFVPNAITFHFSAMTGGTREKVRERVETFMYYKFRNTALLFMRQFPFTEACRKIYVQTKKQLISIMHGTADLGTRSYFVVTNPIKTMLAVILGTIVGLFHGIRLKIFKKQSMALPKYSNMKVKESIAKLKRRRSAGVLEAIVFEIARIRNRL